MRELAADERARRRGGGPNVVDPLGSQRRLQALVTIGWSANHLGERLGRDHSHVSRWVRGNEGHRILRSTAEKIAALYAELCEIEGPSHRAWMMGRRKGWAAPWRWWGLDMDDPATQPTRFLRDPDWVAVERIAAGSLSWRGRPMVERRLAVEILYRRGMSPNRIGMLLEGTADPDANSARQVARDLRWLRECGLAARRAS